MVPLNNSLRGTLTLLLDLINEVFSSCFVSGSCWLTMIIIIIKIRYVKFYYLFIILGYKVSNTVRKGIFDVEMYSEHEKILMFGYLSALIGKYCILHLFSEYQKVNFSSDFITSFLFFKIYVHIRYFFSYNLIIL